jgi:hypothetical protein
MKYISTAVAASKLFLKANAPTIMVVGGVASMGVGTVLAAKQTLKVEEVLEKHVLDLEKIKVGESLELKSYDAEVAMSDRFRVYSRVGFDLGKIYAVPGVLWLGGAAMVFGGHRILLQRNATLAVAFTSVTRAFEAYRERVRQQFGVEADQGMMNGWKTTSWTDEVSGESKIGPTRDWDAKENDPYNRIFAQGESSAWRPDLGVNKMFIHQQREFAQQKLNMTGQLYLCDVYEALGFPESDVSRIVGWMDKRLPDGSRDIPFVDFGLDKPLPDDWKYNAEKAIYLDFNCQGLIVGGKVQKILERA